MDESVIYGLCTQEYNINIYISLINVAYKSWVQTVAIHKDGDESKTEEEKLYMRVFRFILGQKRSNEWYEFQYVNVNVFEEVHNMMNRCMLTLSTPKEM